MMNTNHSFYYLTFLVSKFNGNLNGEDFKDKNVNLSASINKDSKKHYYDFFHCAQIFYSRQNYYKP